MSRWLVVVALALISVSVSVSSTAHADKLRVAIIPSSPNLDPVKVDQLGQDLAQALESELEVEALGGLDVRRELPPDLSPNCVNEPPCPADLATKLKAQQLLFVVFIDVGGALQVDSMWFDSTTKQSAPRSAIDIPTPAEARQKFVDAARKLLPDATVKKKPGGGGGGTQGVMTPEVPRHFTTASKVTAGAAVVGLGLGVTFAVIARGKYNDCDGGKPCTQDDHDSIRRMTLLADLGFGIAIGGTIATAILYATSGKESRLVIESNPTGATVGARFRW